MLLKHMGICSICHHCHDLASLPEPRRWLCLSSHVMNTALSMLCNTVSFTCACFGNASFLSNSGLSSTGGAVSPPHLSRPFGWRAPGSWSLGLGVGVRNGSPVLGENLLSRRCISNSRSCESSGTLRCSLLIPEDILRSRPLYLNLIDMKLESVAASLHKRLSGVS